jgi:hypothetical protein
MMFFKKIDCTTLREVGGSILACVALVYATYHYDEIMYLLSKHW